MGSEQVGSEDRAASPMHRRCGAIIWPNLLGPHLGVSGSLARNSGAPKQCGDGPCGDLGTPRDLTARPVTA
eukprot:6207498-Pyramimonas_sp.AAC.1